MLRLKQTCRYNYLTQTLLPYGQALYNEHIDSADLADPDGVLPFH